MAITFHTFLLQLLLFLFTSFAEENDPRKIYLVQMKVGGHRFGSSSGHQELLGEVLDDDSTVANAFIYSYKESFTGFSARLTQNERQKLKRRREVLEVLRSRNLKLHTTRSWDFMNLKLIAERNPKKESNLVVAVIDSGIWPYSELFSSDSPPPPSWQNKCENITCNNKIVGARSYYPAEKYKWIEEKSVIDITGHGTHVASIVSGREIEKASYFGLAKGTMRGGVPNAKIAVYKTCWSVIRKKSKHASTVCPEQSILKAIDDAIEDKVDIISYSQGYGKPRSLEKDVISWAFLRALENGILTSAAAGNNGDSGEYSIVENGAPWIMTVAASSKDRFFETKLELEGENEPITTYNTINTFETQDSFYPLWKETPSAESTRKRELFAESKDDPILSKYKNEEEKDVFFEFSGVLLDKAIKERDKGVIILNEASTYNESEKSQFPIASVVLDTQTKGKLLEYYEKDKSKHAAKIHKTVEIAREEGWIPTVADISSRGPNRFIANILKPDLAAPGLDIIAGWPENVKLTSGFGDNDYRHLRFNILTGTSMACPHATGLALYVKSFTHSWSPSAIKSALMATSTEMIDEGNEFAYGAGHLNATKVLEPGLIYEIHHHDYIDYMCKQGYNTEELRSNVGSDKIDCSGTKKDPNADLNYPTMTALVEHNKPFTRFFHRTVTNVDDRNATYVGEIKYRGMKNFIATITVDPTHLEFSKLGETKTFMVTATGNSNPNMENPEDWFMTGNTWLTWTEIDGSRQVRSPIVIYSIPPPKPKGSQAFPKFPKN